MSFFNCALALMYAHYWHSHHVFSMECLTVLKGANTIPDGVLQWSDCTSETGLVFKRCVWYLVPTWCISPQESAWEGRDVILFTYSWPAAYTNESILGAAIVGGLGLRCFCCGVLQRWFIPVRHMCPGAWGLISTWRNHGKFMKQRGKGDECVKEKNELRRNWECG